MIEYIAEQLKSINMLRGLSDDVLISLAEKVFVHKFHSDDVLMKKDDIGNSLFLITKGFVKVVAIDLNGNELILNKYGPGFSVGEMALLDSQPRSASVIALEEVEAIELKQEIFQELINLRPDVSIAIIQDYTKRLRFSTNYIEKAISWAQNISVGDYSFLESTQPIESGTNSDDDKAAQLLSTFYSMVRKVKAREEGLKQQLERLTFQIDQERRKQEFEEITSTEFYSKLKEQAQTLRKKRQDS